uniref:Uncharacterized protein n=1 Tax=Oryza brachyantha TaxID=4533 RepID=J3N9D3_ORYBR
MASFMPNHSTVLLASLPLPRRPSNLLSLHYMLQTRAGVGVRGGSKCAELCIDARDPEPGVKALETIFPKLEYRFEVMEFVTLIPHVIANLTAEAKALVDPLIAATMKKGGKLPMCLESCTASLTEVSEAMFGLPATINSGYPKVEKFLHKSFAEDAGPPMCVSGCPDKSCSPEEKIIADKFHAIWGPMDCVEPYADNYLAPLHLHKVNYPVRDMPGQLNYLLYIYDVLGAVLLLAEVADNCVLPSSTLPWLIRRRNPCHSQGLS